jgi:inhibitor of cysteine peptidase
MTLPPIKVHVGDTFEASVPSNPGSTGFVCAMGKMPGCVYLVSMTFVPSLGAPGTPGSEIFKFVAIAKGSGGIEFKHVKFSKPLEIYPKEPDMTHQMEYRFVIVE